MNVNTEKTYDACFDILRAVKTIEFDACLSPSEIDKILEILKKRQHVRFYRIIVEVRSSRTMTSIAINTYIIVILTKPETILGRCSRS